ncbi:MAG: amidase [bacterium]
MTDDPLHYQSLAALGRALRAGEVSPVELTEHAFRRIEKLDGRLGAFRLLSRERAMAEAHAAEGALGAGQDLGPLHGIPYAVKDLYNVKGLPTTAGTSLLANEIAAEDCAAVRKLTQAGMILLGKTNTVQFAYGGVGINHDHGTPHNPWNEIACTPGGSSSGSGVAVASGMAPMALGSDTGGSVRIPAALNGTTGLKTTVGRISRAGVFPLSWSLDTVGPLTRSVEDAALVYQALHGPDLADDTTLGRDPQDVLTGLNDGVRGLRIAFAEAAFWEGVDDELAAAVRETGKVFQQLGAQVGSIEFREAEQARLLNPRGLVIAAEAYTLNQKLVREQFDKLDPIVSNRLILGADVSASEYLQAMLDLKKARASAVRTLRDVDALLVPTTMAPALPVAEVDADRQTYAETNMKYLRNTAIGNILDLSGLSVPCGFTAQGMPIGLMIYGKPFDEDTVLRVGHAFQQATDWHRQTPPLAWAGD